MKINGKGKTTPTWLAAAVCLVFTLLGYLQFVGFGSKYLTLAAGLGMIAMLVFGELKKLCNLPSLLLIAYVLFSWLTAIWAMAGKFHLREWSKILVALTVFLFIMLRKRVDCAFARCVMGVIAGMSAIFAFASVEAAATGVCKALVLHLPGTAAMQIAFNSSRLYGIFGNSNVEASLFAIGILFSIALLCGSENKRQRVLYSATLSLNAFAFLLVFSMGAIVCFAAAVVVYLISAGEHRGAALMRMLEAAVPTVVFVFFSTRFFNSDGKELFAVLLMLVNAAVTVVLELYAAEKVSAVLGKHQKLTFAVMIAAVALCAAYAFLGLQMTGAYTFGDRIFRTARLGAGEHTLQIEADGEIKVYIYSQDRSQVLLNSSTELYYAVPEGEITFTVPEGAAIVSFRFDGADGTTLYSAAADGQELPLHYKLLPGFIGNRIQNLTDSRSQVERGVFREDGLKLFRLSPIIGNGVGAFETGVTAVQDYPYETKYVHNHYIQILLEDGVIGFALYAASLLAMAVALWKKRRQTEESEFYWLYPALCAEFVMNGAQMCWDVSMSVGVFTAMTYATYALIVRSCAEPLKREETPAEEKPKKGKKRAAKEKEVPLPRIAAVTAAGLVVLTLCGNLYAQRLGSMPVSSEEGFFRNQEKAVRLDLYEHNDSKLSYVVNSAQTGMGNHRSKADEYARELSRVQSNTIPRYLTAYYLQTGQYEAAIDEAMLGATYSATDADTWNKCAGLLRQVFVDSGENSPLLTDGETLLPKLCEYRAMLEAHNASALVPVELDENAQGFFDKVAALEACADDTQFAITLLTQ